MRDLEVNNKPKKYNTSNEIKKAATRNAFILGLFAFVSTGLITLTHHLTKDKISAEIELSLIRQLTEIVDPKNYDNDVYKNCILVRDLTYLSGDVEQKVYRMTKQNSNYGLMLTLIAADGYSGPIEIAMAVKANGQILGVNILNHKETPGLGDKIERRKSHWLDQFNDRSLKNLSDKDWQVKKDGGQFDALTGATITPRAVIKSVKNGLEFIKISKHELFSKAANCYNQQTNSNEKPS